MRLGDLKSLIIKTNTSIPALVIAVFGLGLALFTDESLRVSSLQSIPVSSLDSSFVSFLAALMLAFLAFIYKVRPRFRLHRQRPVGILIASGMSLCILYNFDILALPESSAVFFISRCLLRCFTMALFVCWAEILLGLRARQMAVIFALSLFVLSGINALTAMLKSVSAYTIIALTPLISIFFLYWFKDRLESDDSFQRSRHNWLHSGHEGDHSLINKQATFFNSWPTFLLPLPCFSFIFGIIHNAWIPTQDGASVSTQIQVGAAFGTLLGGLLLLLLITYFWGRRRIELYALIALPVLILALYLTTMLEESLSFAYVIPLNIVQKYALFSIWMTPFLVPSKNHPLTIWALAELLYQIGKGLSTLTLNVITPDNVLFITCITLVFVMVSVVIGIMLDQNKSAFEESEEGMPVSSVHEITNDFPPLTLEEVKSPTSNNKTSIAQEYRLTQREEEVLELLAQGMKASAIAEELFISTSTAKSHIRNIYAKLGIHTQSELLLLVHQKENAN